MLHSRATPGRWLLVLSILGHLTGVAAYGQEPRFETEANLVLSDVAVFDRATSKPIVNLQQSDFVVLDEGIEREIKLFEQAVEGLDLVLLLDASSKVTESRENYADAVAAAFDPLWLQDQVAVMSFATKPRLVAPFTNNPGTIDDALREITRSRRRSTRAKNLDAVEAAVKLFPPGRRDPRWRRAILMITHNEEKPGEKRSSHVIAQLLEAEVTLHAVVVERFDWRPGRTSWTVLNLPGRPLPKKQKTVPTEWVPRPDWHTIDPIVAATGGELILEGDPMKEFLAVALTRLRLHYLLGFHGVSESKRGNEFRRLRIEISAVARKRHPGALVRHRQGYFARKLK